MTTSPDLSAMSTDELIALQSPLETRANSICERVQVQAKADALPWWLSPTTEDGEERVFVWRMLRDQAQPSSREPA